VESIAGTRSITTISTFARRSTAPIVSRNFSAAPKKNGPSISYTSTPFGTSAPRSPASPASPSSRVSAVTLVTSAMRSMKRNAASTIPTWIATVRSTATVSTKVVSSTATSLRGAVSSDAKVRHSLMW
jgi:hypothetical protein